MGYGDYYWGLYRDYYRDPFPDSLLSTRQLCQAQADWAQRRAQTFDEEPRFSCSELRCRGGGAGSSSLSGSLQGSISSIGSGSGLRFQDRIQDPLVSRDTFGCPWVGFGVRWAGCSIGGLDAGFRLVLLLGWLRQCFPSPSGYFDASALEFVLLGGMLWQTFVSLHGSKIRALCGPLWQIMVCQP